MSPRPPPKISLRHDWTKELGSKVDRQPQKKLLDNHEEKFLDKQNSSNQPNQSQNQSVIDQGNLITNTKCLLIKAKTSWSRETKEKSFHEKLCSSDRSGQPDITPSVIRAQTNLSGEIRVEQTHDRSGQSDQHEIALRAAPEVHREITTLNTDNELTRERIEEDMNFKIPGPPHSTVEQLQSENHPNRRALQRDLQQSQSFNPFSRESKQMIHEVEKIELCELLDTEPKTQCKVCLSYWDVGIVYCTCGHFLRKGTEENKKFVQYTMDLLSIPNYYIKKGRPHGHRYGKKPGDREYYIAHSLKKKCKKKNFLGIPRPIHTRRKVPQEQDWQQSNRRNLSPNGWPCGRRPHSPFNSSRNWRLQE